MGGPFDYHPGAFAGVELDALIDGLAWEQHTISLYGKTWPVPRLLAMYGAAYAYSGIQHPARPLPELLAPLHSQIETFTGRRFNSVLGNLYRDGSDSVGWHSDDESGAIVSVSFGATRRFRVRPKAGGPSMAFDLGHGDMLIMGDTAQADFQHCITKTSRQVGPRVNLTFRYI